MELLSDYFFSNKELKQYTKTEKVTLELGIDIITTHGVGGKFVEKLIHHQFDVKDVPTIHGWDGLKNSRPVEIKTETINNTKKLNCCGSFSDHREDTIRKSDLFRSEKPLLYSVGVDDVTGKCLYVMKTDFAKIKEDSLIFERLNAKAPRIGLNHWVEQKSAYEIPYMNMPLIDARGDHISSTLMRCFVQVLYKNDA
jgi:hypothetical protein